MFKKNFTKEKLWFKNKRGQKIYGELYLPKKGEASPLVIFSHGYGWNMSVIDAEDIAQNGIAVCEFDFCGGSAWSRSDGKSTEMSVLTEAEDLEAVIDGLKNNPLIDSNRIYLSGQSQGGFVSIIVASRRKEEIRGMILYCPALSIHDYEQTYLHGRKMPEKLRMSNMIISRKYVEDAKNCDIYSMMEDFDGKVLYYHGDMDELVPVSYAYKAEKHFTNIELTILNGAGHMLGYGRQKQLLNELIEFIR